MYESSSFVQYKAVNEAFADAVARVYKEGDVSKHSSLNVCGWYLTLFDFNPPITVWINDYHLLLLPQMLRARLPTAAISFFLHVAFPSPEIFRCLAGLFLGIFCLGTLTNPTIARESLLRGMLGADLIGFQTHSYARHFRHTVSRILSVEATPKGIQLFSNSGINEGRIQANSPEDIAQAVFAVKVRFLDSASKMARCDLE